MFYGKMYIVMWIVCWSLWTDVFEMYAGVAVISSTFSQKLSRELSRLE
jgi:hypothetical protein